MVLYPLGGSGGRDVVTSFGVNVCLIIDGQFQFHYNFPRVFPRIGYITITMVS